MWGKVCQSVCPPPQKTDMLDQYLAGFFYCGMTFIAVAERWGVTPDAVEKALKRYDLEACLMERSRRKEENRHERQQKDRERKHNSDAQQKDRERKHTPATREKDRERKRCEREEKNTYVAAVRKALQDSEVVALLRLAAREPDLAWEQWLCTRYIPEAKAIQHPCPGPAKESVELITPGEAGGRAEYEFRQIRGGMVGVPGPALLQIRPALEYGDLGKAYQLAREAVLRAGFVNPQASPVEVTEGMTRTYLPREVEALHVDLVESGRALAKIPEPKSLAELNKKEKEEVVKRWMAQARAAERENMWCGTSGTGKRGKEGGIRDAGRGVIMSAMTRN